LNSTGCLIRAGRGVPGQGPGHLWKASWGRLRSAQAVACRPRGGHSQGRLPSTGVIFACAGC